MKIVGMAFRYKTAAILNIIFNFLYVIFNLASLLVFIPFLQLLFGDTPDQVVAKPEWDKVEIGDFFEQYFSYLMSDYIAANGALGALAFICIAAGTLFFLKNLSRYLAMFFLASVRQNVVRDLRFELYSKVVTLPIGYHSEERKGDIISRLTNDLQEVDYSVMSTLELLFREPLAIVVSLGIMIYMSWELTLFSFILLPVGALTIGRIGKSLKRSSEKGQSKLGEIVSNIEESLSGLKVIKAFTAENHVKGKFKGLVERYRQIMTRLYRKRDLASPLSEWLGSLVMIALVWFGGKLVLEGSSSGGLEGKEFIGFIMIFSQLLRPVQGIANAWGNISKGIASVDRLEAILSAENEIKDGPNAKPKAAFDQKIAYENVTFAYTDAPVLKNVSFTLEKGKTIALVGESGGGKSTIADLLPRFYDIKEGQITIDGHKVKDIKVADLRSLMGIVAQKSVLFNDTVFSNIAFGADKATEEDVIRAAKIANAHDFIMKLENGYQTNIGDGGNKLSGGQQQRLSIARAVLKNPPILILDEATSALDPESEKLVQDALLRLMDNRTTLVIAHRLSTIQHADEILVINAGEVAERGTHHELIAQGGIYKRLHDLQSFA